MPNLIKEALEDYQNQISLEFLGGLFKGKPKITPDNKGVRVLEETYLNDRWLSNQKFLEGNFKYKWPHGLQSDPKETLSFCVKHFENVTKENTKRLKLFIQQTNPIKELILKNPNITVDVIEPLTKKVTPLEIVDPTETIKVAEIPLASKDTIRPYAQLIKSALNHTEILTKEAHALYNQIVENYYGTGSLRSKTNDPEVGALLISLQDEKVLSMDYEYETEHGFKGYLLAVLIRPTISLLKQSTK